MLQVCIDPETLDQLAASCAEFLVHGVDVEGKQLGIDEQLVSLLGQHSPIPVTYAGGVASLVCPSLAMCLLTDLSQMSQAGPWSDCTAGVSCGVRSCVHAAAGYCGRNHLGTAAAPGWKWLIPCTDNRTLSGDMQLCCLHHARLGQYQGVSPNPLHMLQEDLALVETAGAGCVDVTVGSALDIFGGRLAFDDVLKWHRRK